MTLTLEIPDDLAARMESIPADQRNNYAVAALRVGTSALSEVAESGFLERESRLAALASETVLSRLWNTQEEDQAWQHL